MPNENNLNKYDECDCLTVWNEKLSAEGDYRTTRVQTQDSKEGLIKIRHFANKAEKCRKCDVSWGEDIKCSKFEYLTYFPLYWDMNQANIKKIQGIYECIIVTVHAVWNYNYQNLIRMLSVWSPKKNTALDRIWSTFVYSSTPERGQLMKVAQFSWEVTD